MLRHDDHRSIPFRIPARAGGGGDHAREPIGLLVVARPGDGQRQRLGDNGQSVGAVAVVADAANGPVGLNQAGDACQTARILPPP